MLDRPSNLWSNLGALHSHDLNQYGFEEIKRRQALRYFTWRWNFSGIVRSEQMRFLLRHTSPIMWIRCAHRHVDLSDKGWGGVSWMRHDRWLYCFAVRLLWEYSKRRGALSVLELAEPLVGGPLPVYWDGRLISQDLANGALEAEAILRAMDGHAPSSILEVGAGYGRTAYVLMNLFPRATYTIVDIEPAITISRWYLSQLFPGDRLKFLAPSDAEREPPGSFDLALSISSLQEMTPAQVKGYLAMFDRLASGGVVFLKQWRKWHNPDDDITLEFREYPLPSSWHERFIEESPVQTEFEQGAWRVP